MEPILLQAVVEVLSVWIGAKFAGAEQANWGNALLAGLEGRQPRIGSPGVARRPPPIR